MTNPTVPIFLIASERSGTNLLRMRLNTWQSTAFGPSPAHFFKHLYDLEPYYGELSIYENFKQLVNDALDLCYIHFSPWKHRFSFNEIFEAYQDAYGDCRHSILLADLIMTKFAKINGFTTYFCKDNHLFNFVFELLFYLPEAKFIYLHRDPRDYVLSQQKRSLMTSNPYQIALLWRNEQIRCIRTYTEPALKNKIMKISYEDFVQNEEQILDRICEFSNLQIKHHKTITKFQGTAPEEWENIDKPTFKTNYNKFMTEMSLKQIKRIESIVWNQMRFLGYRTVSNKRPKRNSIDMLITYLRFLLLDQYQKLRFSQKKKFRHHFLRYKFIKQMKNRMY